MAIYHLSAKPISRAQGRSATGAAAYRAGVEITDERTGLVHDYTRKGGVLHSELILPGGGTADRAEFWNGIEAHHKRGDAVLVREVEISLPTELTAEQRQALAVGYARELADRYGVAADVALHAPRTVTDRELEKNPDQYHETDPETGRRHNGNWHAHIMLSACHVQPDGTLGKKAVELDPIHCQRAKIENMADRERARWGELANAALERHGHEARIDHRSHAERGIAAEPSQHLGPQAHGYEQRTGLPSNVRQIREAANAARAAFDAAAIQAAEADVIELEAQLDALQREQREQQRRAALAAQYEAHELALARLPLVPTVNELAQHLRDWPEPKLRELALEQVRRGPLSIPSTDERREAARLQQVQREQERERSALRASVQELCAERDQRQRRSWFRRLFDKRLPSVLQQIEAVERRWDALRAERRVNDAAVLKAQAAAEAADNAARALALAALETVIERAVQSADAPLPSSSPPQELARAAPAPATPEPLRILRPR